MTAPSARYEGSLSVEGLFEVAVALEPDGEHALECWGQSARALGLELEREGERLQVFGDGVLRPRPEGGAEARVEALGALLALLPEECRARAFSTLRVRETRPGAELRTLIAVQADGRLDARTERVELETRPPERARARALLRVASTLLAVISAASLWYFWPSAGASDPGSVSLDQEQLGELVVLVQLEWTREGCALRVGRGDDFPEDRARLEALLAGPELEFERRIALESLARGYLHWEAFDADGDCLRADELRVSELWETWGSTILIDALPASTSRLRLAP